MSEKIKLNIFIALTIIFWASAYVAIRAGLHGYSPGSLALFRFLVASVCMLVFFLRSDKQQKLSFKQVCQTIGLGIIGYSIYHFSLNYGEITVQAGIACFIVSQVPVLITIFAIMFLHERLTVKGWIGTGISILGLIIIAHGSKINAHFDSGLIFVGIAAIAGALYTALQKPLLKHINPITLTSYSIWAGTFFLLFFLPDLIHEIPHAPISATLAAIYLGVFPASIAYLLWSYALKHHSATKLGSTLYIAPLGTMFMGWIFLGEIPGLLGIGGGLLALLGAFLVNRGVKAI